MYLKLDLGKNWISTTSFVEDGYNCEAAIASLMDKMKLRVVPAHKF